MRKVLLALLLAVTMLVPLSGYARSYNARFDKASPEAVINTLRQETGLEFVYQKVLLNNAKRPVTCNYKDLSIEQLLNRVLYVHMLSGYERVGKSVTLKTPES